MRKKGYAFNVEEKVCIVPANTSKRNRRQEKRLEELGVSIHYNMFQSEEEQKKEYLQRLVLFLNQVQYARVAGKCNNYSRLSVSIGKNDRGLVMNVQIFAHDPGHPERQPIFNSNYYIAENDTLEDIKNTIACVYMDIDAGLFFNKMDKSITNPLSNETKH